MANCRLKIMSTRLEGVAVTTAAEASIIDLPERLDSAAALDLYKDIDRFKDAPLALDGSNVVKVGGLCLQVLITAQEEWQRRGLAFKIKSPSEALTEFLTALGREELLDSEPACP